MPNMDDANELKEFRAACDNFHRTFIKGTGRKTDIKEIISKLKKSAEIETCLGFYSDSKCASERKSFQDNEEARKYILSKMESIENLDTPDLMIDLKQKSSKFDRFLHYLGIINDFSFRYRIFGRNEVYEQLAGYILTG
jgi:hypothetical protein